MKLLNHREKTKISLQAYSQKFPLNNEWKTALDLRKGAGGNLRQTHGGSYRVSLDLRLQQLVVSRSSSPRAPERTPSHHQQAPTLSHLVWNNPSNPCLFSAPQRSFPF